MPICYSLRILRPSRIRTHKTLPVCPSGFDRSVKGYTSSAGFARRQDTHIWQYDPFKNGHRIGDLIRYIHRSITFIDRNTPAKGEITKPETLDLRAIQIERFDSIEIVKIHLFLTSTVDGYPESFYHQRDL